MKVCFEQVDSLPKLAWCAMLREGQGTVRVTHGPWVETADGFFCEGAWSGPFSERALDAGILMGSGGRVSGATLVVAAPNHTLERLFVLRRRGTLFVSNSLAFVLASAHDNVDPHNLLYSLRLASIVDGLQNYGRSLRTRNGDRVRLYYHCNLSIDARLRVREEPKAPVPEFTSFADYKAFLFQQVRALHANASDVARKVVYEPIATMSSGYDSPASAVLARAVGCSEALTFREARTSSPTDEVSDSGEAIAAKLGMKVHAYSRLDYLKQQGCPETEFFGWGAQEAPWASHLTRRLVFTGYHGGKVWDKNCQKVTPHIVRGDPGGHNLNPFRLRVGWIHLPVPFLGCTSHPSIHRISNSDEMRPWTLQNRYDRPIPRRLVEEAGVGRHEFGMTKKATSLALDSEGFRDRMTRESYEDYTEYYAKHWTRSMVLQRAVLLLLRGLYLRHQTLNSRVAAFVKRTVGLRLDLPILLPRDFRIGRYGDLDHLSLLVHWSTEKILPQYAVERGSEAGAARVV